MAHGWLRSSTGSSSAGSRRDTRRTRKRSSGGWTSSATRTEDDPGHNWAVLSDARNVEDLVPGSAVVMGSSIGRYLAKVIAWDFEVSDEDPIVTLELLPIRPNEVQRLLGRNRTPAA